MKFVDYQNVLDAIRDHLQENGVEPTDDIVLTIEGYLPDMHPDQMDDWDIRDACQRWADDTGAF